MDLYYHWWNDFQALSTLCKALNHSKVKLSGFEAQLSQIRKRLLLHFTWLSFVSILPLEDLKLCKSAHSNQSVWDETPIVISHLSFAIGAFIETKADFHSSAVVH